MCRDLNYANLRAERFLKPNVLNWNIRDLNCTRLSGLC